MKHILMAALVVTLCTAGVTAQISFTQSLDTTTITTFNSVSCNAGGLHTDNAYGRSYSAADFGSPGFPLDVVNVMYGIETAVSGSGAGQPVAIRLYDDPAGAPGAISPYAGLTLLCSEGPFNVPDQAATIFTQEFCAPCTVDFALVTRLVVEVFTPDGQAAGHSFFIGSNPNGETNPSFLAAAACGFPDYVDTAAIGFATMDIVELVTVKPTPAPGGLTGNPAECGGPKCPGTESIAGDDITQITRINGAAQAGDTHSIAVGDVVQIDTFSPGASLNGQLLFVLAELYPTGFPPTPPGPPGLGICVSGNPATTVLVAGGAVPPAGFPLVLPVGGHSYSFVYSGGFAGLSLMSQSIISAPSPFTANGIFASNNGHCLDLN